MQSNYDYLETIFLLKVPTDGLVLRGWYTTITLAVYGIPREAMQEQTSTSNAHTHSHLTLPSPCLASESLPPPEAVAASAATQEWVQQHAQVCFYLLPWYLDFCCFCKCFIEVCHM